MENLINKQLRLDKQEKLRIKELELAQKAAEKQALLVQEHESEIIEMNKASSEKVSKPSQTREAVLMALVGSDDEDADEDTNEVSEEDDDDQSDEEGDEDVIANNEDQGKDNDEDATKDEEIEYQVGGSAYIPCAAHNIQLVIKDGLKLSAEFELLLLKVAKNIVNKSKFSTIIAEELRSMAKKFCKRNKTRWNSILFMIRSVLKVSASELKQIQNSMPNKTSKEKTARKNFSLTAVERAMLEELKDLLELFEFVTNEFQTDDVSISRVYPSIKSLLFKLVDKLDEYKYTQTLRMDFKASLIKRFNSLMDTDLCKVATFLDPYFNIEAIEPSDQPALKARIKSLLKVQRAVVDEISEIEELTETQSAKKPKLTKEEERKQNYIRHVSVGASLEKPSAFDEYDLMINEYLLVASKTQITDPLVFWKQYSTSFPLLANIARKYLSVQASSAAVERMFSIAGHIFSLKRRKLGTVYFSNLTLLKLNENLIDLLNDTNL
jgi:hypothetical protein